VAPRAEPAALGAAAGSACPFGDGVNAVPRNNQRCCQCPCHRFNFTETAIDSFGVTQEGTSDDHPGRTGMTCGTRAEDVASDPDRKQELSPVRAALFILYAYKNCRSADKFDSKRSLAKPHKFVIGSVACTLFKTSRPTFLW
jgi:hypothetical protein